MMWIINVGLLIALGVLGVAALLRQRKPHLDRSIKKLQSVESWVGVVGLIWGLIGLLQWILAIGALAAAPIGMLLSLASILVMLALSLIFSIRLIGSWLGSNFSSKLAQASERLLPFRVILGGACLAFAAYGLVRLIV
jgi:uncharacterized protein involved in cysteine biosynthesis